MARLGGEEREIAVGPEPSSGVTGVLHFGPACNRRMSNPCQYRGRELGTESKGRRCNSSLDSTFSNCPEPLILSSSSFCVTSSRRPAHRFRLWGNPFSSHRTRADHRRVRQHPITSTRLIQQEPPSLSCRHDNAHPWSIRSQWCFRSCEFVQSYQHGGFLYVTL